MSLLPLIPGQPARLFFGAFNSSDGSAVTTLAYNTSGLSVAVTRLTAAGVKVSTGSALTLVAGTEASPVAAGTFGPADDNAASGRYFTDVGASDTAATTWDQIRLVVTTPTGIQPAITTRSIRTGWTVPGGQSTNDSSGTATILSRLPAGNASIGTSTYSSGDADANAGTVATSLAAIGTNLGTVNGNVSAVGNYLTTNVGANGANLTAVPYAGPSVNAIQSGLATGAALSSLNASVGAIATTGVNVSSGSVAAIANAVWSAATAGLTVAGSIGKLFADFFGRPAVAPAPVRTVTPQPLSQFVDQVATGVAAKLPSTAGDGAFPVTVHVSDASTSAPVQGATIRATINASSFTATSNTSGGATFALDGGTYTVTATANGYAGATTTAVVAAAGQMVELTMTAALLPLPVNPGGVIGAVVKTDGSGRPRAGAVFTFQLIATPSAGNISGSTTPFNSGPTDAGGLSHVEFVAGWTYRGWAGTVSPATAGRGVDFIAPTTPFLVPAILGH